jgi:RNA polymerase sigma factor (sigma-70 family)
MTRIDAKSQEIIGMDIYLCQIRDVSLLTAAEECTLAVAIKAGDGDARSRMIRANLRLVVKIARDYAGRGLSLDDLIGEGNLGLIRAAEDFNPRFGTRFSTYASYWIKQAIRHALTNTTATIRLPAHMVTLLAKWRKAERALARELGLAPTFDQVAVTLGLSDAQRVLVERARQASQLRLEGGDDESWSPDEAGDHREGPDAALEAEDERRHLLRRLDRLDDRERTIVSLRFGLDGDDPMTLKEVGRRLGVTREWVRKIEARAVKKLEGEAPAGPKAGETKPNRRRAIRPVAQLQACPA